MFAEVSGIARSRGAGARQEAMQGDHGFIFRASSQASKVADYLLSFTRQPETVAEPEEICVPF